MKTESNQEDPNNSEREAGSRARTSLRFPYSVKCEKPKMKCHRGATWDICPVIDSNGEEIEGFLDTSWGHYVYFPCGDHWRKAKIDQLMNDHDNTADFRCANKILLSS